MPHVMKAERNNEIVRLRNEGWTVKAIGLKFGLCASTVREILLRAEIREIREKRGRV